jgi:DNA-binding transcriptional regulator GbsR (MarR family)
VFTPGTEEDACFRYAELTHNNKTLTAEEWADKLEMSYTQFRDRYRRYFNLNTVEKAFEPINNFGVFKYQQLTCNNETLTAEEWAIKLQMPFENFRMRYNDYNKKGQVEKAFVPPRKEYFGTEELTHNDVTLTAEQWAKRLGMSYTQFRKRYWRFSDLGRVEDAFTPIETNLTKFADDLLTHPKTGETLTVREWSKKLNQTVAQLYPKVRKYGNCVSNYYKIFEPLKRKGRVKK